MQFLAMIIAAGSLGAMLFFSAVVAPTVFQSLDAVSAGRFLRAIFPKYFVINGVAAIVAGILAARLFETTLLVLSGAALIGVAWFAIPVINRARDAMLAGNEQARLQFNTLHRGSVIVNVIEMAALGVAMAGLAGAS